MVTIPNLRHGRNIEIMTLGKCFILLLPLILFKEEKLNVKREVGNKLKSKSSY
jgi:hypothetical protein